MIRLLYKLVFFIPIILLVILINYFVDPANLYRHHFPVSEGQSYEETVARYLAAGYNVANVETLDERVLQKKFISFLPADATPELVILGSSRCQLIGKNIFPEKDVLNNGVTGATVEDLLAILNIYDSLHLTTEEILIELSPWYLNDNNGQTRWKSISSDYVSFVKKIQSKEVETIKENKTFSWMNPKIYELISFEYFQQSVRLALKNKTEENSSNAFNRSEFVNGFDMAKFYRQVSPLIDSAHINKNDTLATLNNLLTKSDLITHVKRLFPLQEFPDEIISVYNDMQKEIRNNQRRDNQTQNFAKLNRKLLEVVFYETCPPSEEALTYPTTSRDNSGLTRLADGTISYPRSFRHQTVTEVSQAVRSFLTAPIFGLQDFMYISDSKLALLECVLKYLQNKNVTVRLVLVPYHPNVYQILINDEKYQHALTAETIYKKLAKKTGTEILGAYNPVSCQLTAIDFYDAMHPKEDAYKRILNTRINN